MSWSHYKLLMRIGNEKERGYYAEECVKSGWRMSIYMNRIWNRHFYIDGDNLPTEEELKRELNLENFESIEDDNE